MRIISIRRHGNRWVVTLDGKCTAYSATNVRDAARLAYQVADQRCPYARRLVLSRFISKKTDWALS